MNIIVIESYTFIGYEGNNGILLKTGHNIHKLV